MKQAHARSIYLPQGKRVQDVLPQFAEVRDELVVGTPAPDCAGCRKTFSAARKRKMNVRLYLTHCPAPIAFAYCLCGACTVKYRRGGQEREAIVAAVNGFHLGDEPACA